jgi:sugar lactone lactonase YvrE
MQNRQAHKHFSTQHARYLLRILFVLLIACIAATSIPLRHAYSAGVSPAAFAVYGQAGSFTSSTANNGGVSANSLSNPRRVALDSSGNLYVSDYNNNRVLFYPAGSTTATRVYGQNSSFTSNTANNGGISATSLNQPKSVAVDASGNLYIADTGNNRVLFYPAGSTTATRVYGQNGSFTSNALNGSLGVASASTLNQPGGVSTDASGNLYIADTNNNRVLFFSSGSTTATTVYGQLLSFVTNTADSPLGTPSASNLNQPISATIDSSGNLYVADLGNNRVLFYPSGSTTATRVYGQAGSFTSNTANNGGVSATSLSSPYGVAIDANGNIYIVDTGNNRILYYPGSATTAIRVYGQAGSFTSNTANNGGVSATSLNAPVGIIVDSTSTIYVADNSNNRVLKFQTTLSFTTQPPATVAVNGTFTPVVSLIDRGSGSVFSDFTGTITVAIQSGSGTSGATLSGTLVKSATAGSATFSNLSINTAGTGYILTATSPGVGTATSSSFIVSGPLLYIPLTSPSFSFTLNGTTGVVTSQRTFRVSDTTQLNAGWHVTITSTQFQTTSGNTLPTSALTITAVTTACTASQTCVLPTNRITTYPITVPAGTTQPTAVTYFSAAAGTGTGDVTVTTTFSLTIPPGTAAGTYTSTLTETLVKGQ